MITDYWNAGKLEELDPAHLDDETEPGLRQFLESIRYRIVDEYSTEFSITPESSEKPLALGELVGLIDTTNGGEYGGLALCFNGQNLQEWTSPETLRNFTTVNSPFYPDLFDHYDAIHEQWVKEALEIQAEKQETEEDEDD